MKPSNSGEFVLYYPAFSNRPPQGRPTTFPNVNQEELLSSPISGKPLYAATEHSGEPRHRKSQWHSAKLSSVENHGKSKREVGPFPFPLGGVQQHARESTTYWVMTGLLFPVYSVQTKFHR